MSSNIPITSETLADLVSNESIPARIREVVKLIIGNTKPELHFNTIDTRVNWRRVSYTNAHQSALTKLNEITKTKNTKLPYNDTKAKFIQSMVALSEIEPNLLAYSDNGETWFLDPYVYRGKIIKDYFVYPDFEAEIEVPLQHFNLEALIDADWDSLLIEPKRGRPPAKPSPFAKPKYKKRQRVGNVALYDKLNDLENKMSEMGKMLEEITNKIKTI